MTLPFDPVWADGSANLRVPTAAELADGFPCGPADKDLFNQLFLDIQNAINNNSIQCLSVLTAAGITPAAGVPAVYNDDVNESPAALKVWDCTAGGYQTFSISDDDAWKQPVRMVADSNVALTGLQTIDNVVGAADDRVLLTGQTTPAENGIWVMAAGGWTRPEDMDGGSEANGAAVIAMEGDNYAGVVFKQDTAGVTVGTTAQTWSQMGQEIYRGLSTDTPPLNYVMRFDTDTSRFYIRNANTNIWIDPLGTTWEYYQQETEPAGANVGDHWFRDSDDALAMRIKDSAGTEFWKQIA